MLERDIVEIAKNHSSSVSSIDAELVNELKIDGDTGQEFLAELGKREGINLPNVNWSAYFHSESELLTLLYLTRWIGHKLGIRNSPALREKNRSAYASLQNFAAANGGLWPS